MNREGPGEAPAAGTPWLQHSCFAQKRYPPVQWENAYRRSLTKAALECLPGLGPALELGQSQTPIVIHLREAVRIRGRHIHNLLPSAFLISFFDFGRRGLLN